MTLTVTDDDGATGTGSQDVSVDDGSTTTELTIGSFSPDTLVIGTQSATVTGTGFVDGAEVTFENGRGPAPEVTATTVVSDTQIDITVTVKSGGPSEWWDVRVTNPDGSSAVLIDGVYVQR